MLIIANTVADSYFHLGFKFQNVYLTAWNYVWDIGGITFGHLLRGQWVNKKDGGDVLSKKMRCWTYCTLVDLLVCNINADNMQGNHVYISGVTQAKDILIALIWTHNVTPRSARQSAFWSEIVICLRGQVMIGITSVNEVLMTRVCPHHNISSKVPRTLHLWSKLFYLLKVPEVKHFTSLWEVHSDTLL